MDTWREPCALKNASTVWGEIFLPIYLQGIFLLHPTSSGFESRATHYNFTIEQDKIQIKRAKKKKKKSQFFPHFLFDIAYWILLIG